MRILLFNENNLSNLVLPSKIYGSFLLTDDMENINLVNIESINDNWVIKSNDEYKVKYNNSIVNDLILTPNMFVNIEGNNKSYLIYVEQFCDESNSFYQLSSSPVTLGIDNNSDIVYSNQYVFNNYLSLSYDQNIWKIQISDKSIVYVNNSILKQKNSILSFGDVIFVFGLRITLLNGVIAVNNPLKNLIINGKKLVPVEFKNNFNFNEEVIKTDSIKEVDYYKEESYFYKKARVRRFIETYRFKITPPPSKQTKQEMPILLVLGPMLTMGLVSVMSFVNIITRITSGQTTVEQSLTQLISSGAMLMSSLLWPNLTRIYQSSMIKKREKERRKKYKKYISKKKQELIDEGKNQTEILNENLVSLKECENIVLNKKINLWERRSDHRDFLTVRVGNGNVPLDINMKFEEEDFVMDEDPLRKEAESTFMELQTLWNVPVSYSFNNKKVTAIMGNSNNVYDFVDNLLFQLLTFHSYDDLKIIFLTTKQNVGVWSKYKGLPHCFSNDRQVRFFANDIENIKFVSSYLEREFIKRLSNYKNEEIENESKEKTFAPYYLIITDDYPFIRRTGIVENILNTKMNLGYGIVCVDNRLSKIPSACVNFISVNNNNSSILCTDINNYNQQVFNLELLTDIKYNECFKILKNVPIEFVEDIRSLPTMYGFLEMFEVGKVEQLNSYNRWKFNDPTKSLKARVGVNDQGSPIYLDLHEKAHGPHGLIAGTTGSGKSEFIITYILSMALNYSPNEVSFILIDYKGGGLAGAFENKTQGLRLPHLAGTITNLDKSELNRTLVSIDSELKRRQAKFNEERDKLGESTMDIYKYQRLFREGKIIDPMPHLFIISDEFAELKSQQPEFMDDLISAARIGRSLGVHLILATQKPSGVVNDQIWSNTKFRVCLKVQDASDSNEMLKRPDAASITNAGRFFLQVGNDEIFLLGQSGWAGTKYIASETIKRKYDRSISIIDDSANVIKSFSGKSEVNLAASVGDELSNTLKYICDISEKENLRTKNLWLESMSAVSYVDDIIKKYSFNAPSVVTAVVGEFDAPSSQYQGILTVPVNEEGNSLIYSVSGVAREMFLSSYIYSICINYSAEDVNIYVIDYGSETFRLYSKFPQVGDVVYPNEEDKLVKLLSLFNHEIITRKKLFADYNGEYKNYIKNSGKKVPLKVLIINNFDSFKESHDSFTDLLNKLSRECERYGVILVISANNGRSIFSKFALNFHHSYVINMPERNEYIEILGKIGNVVPAEYEGRGLFKLEDTYEFQTANVCEEDKLVEFITTTAKNVSKKFKGSAPNVPSLPDVVTLEMLDSSIKDITKLPIGICKESLNICNYNFFSDKATIVSSKDLIDTVDLLKTIIYGVRKLNQMIVLIDAEQELSSIGGMVNTYVDKNFEQFILRFEQFLDKEIDGKNIKVLCVISGLEKFQNSMDERNFRGFFNGIKSLDNLNVLFVDSSYKLKRVQFEEWFSSITNSSNGIWIGSGFMEQTVFRTDSYDPGHKAKINKQFAWVCKNGTSELVKIVGKGDSDEE